MRPWWTAGVAAISLVLGVALGAIAARPSRPTGDAADGGAPAGRTVPAQAPGAKLRPDDADPPASGRESPPPEGFALVPATHDFGCMREGEVRSVTLRLERPEGAAARIGRAYSPCPCVRVEIAKRACAAGEPLALGVALHSLTLAGAQSFPVFVELLEPRRCVARAEVRCEVRRVPAEMMVVPRAVHLGAVRGSTSAFVEVRNLSARPITITSVACSLQGVRASLKPGTYMRPGAVHTLHLEAVGREMPAGTVAGAVRIETNCDAHAAVRIPVDGTVLHGR